VLSHIDAAGSGGSDANCRVAVQVLPAKPDGLHLALEGQFVLLALEKCCLVAKEAGVFH